MSHYKIKTKSGAIVCDPCYVLADDVYDQWLAGTDLGDGVCSITANGVTMDMMSHSTAYGDGGYDSNVDVVFMVDSGCIAVMPLEIIDEQKFNQMKLWDNGYYIIEGEQEIGMEFDNGTFTIDDGTRDWPVTIWTGDDEEPNDDYNDWPDDDYPDRLYSEDDEWPDPFEDEEQE